VYVLDAAVRRYLRAPEPSCNCHVGHARDESS